MNYISVLHAAPAEHKGEVHIKYEEYLYNS